MQLLSAQQRRRDVSRVLCEFLEVAVHQILFARAVYPAELFERKRYDSPACAPAARPVPATAGPSLAWRFLTCLPLRRRKYNVPVRQSRHKELNDYIANAGPAVLRPGLRAIRAWC